jgi:glycosyltransferase involved in cell wall biosynthesis
VDTSELLRQRRSVTLEETLALRESLGFGAGPVGVFVGSLYVDKRLDFLFAAAQAIRQQIPDFQLLIVGEGPERDKVQAWCAANPWTRWAGARFGREKVVHVSLAQVMLNPGLVGLGILDAFVCGTPMLTTDCGIHSPEIAYLDNGVNGVMTADDVDVYAGACVQLLRDPVALDALRAGCEVSAQEYTVENMARRFADGIVSALASVAGANSDG